LNTQVNRMDVVLAVFDEYFFNPYFPSLSSNSIPILLGKFYFIMALSGLLLYLVIASLSYYYFCYLKLDIYFPTRKPGATQVRTEITTAMKSIPIMAILTCPIAVMEVRGLSLLYDNVAERGLPYLFFSCLWFIVFTDALIYWIHRGLHTIPFLYKYVHGKHHVFTCPTPFASHAFHPVDGFLQGIPYHLFVFIFPLNKYAYLVLFLFVNVWTISIHDGISAVPGDWLNGAAHHTEHHTKFKYNYGQYFTFWDKVGGTYMIPESFKKIE